MPLDFTIGLLGQAAVAHEDVYGVEQLCTISVPFTSESITDSPLLQPSLALDGRAQGRQLNQGTTSIAGDITVALRYGLANAFLRNWFGEYNSSTGRYTHAITTSGQGLTVAIRKGATVWAFFGGKVHNLVINCTLESVLLTASLYFRDFTYDSQINTVATMHALIDPADDILFRHMRFRLGEQDDALTVLDEQGLIGFAATLGRPLDQVFTNQFRGAIEGAETDRPIVTQAFTFPRHRDNEFQRRKTDNVPMQMEWTIENPQGGDTKTFYFPQLQTNTAPINIGGPGAVQVPVDLVASEAERLLLSSAVTATAAGNMLSITAGDAGAAVGTLTLTGVSTDGEIVSIGGRVYEIDTEDDPGNVTAGRVRAEAVSTKASIVLTLDTQVTATDTMTIGSRVYTFQANGALTNGAGNIEIGTTLPATQLNIEHAVNRTGTPGIGYAAATTAHPDVTLSAFVADDATVTAKKGGVAGNAIATTETFTAVTNIFAGATLAGGVSPTAAQTITALVAAITGDAEAVVTAVDGAGDTLVVTALEVGTAGNAIATTTTLANATWGAGTLAGGIAGDNDSMPYCVSGATVWITSPGQGGPKVAEVVSRTDLTMVLTDAAYAAANAGHDGFDVLDEAAGGAWRIVCRSPDVYLIESAA
jgi:hypothetical protein